jgi:hypothetical protein
VEFFYTPTVDDLKKAIISHENDETWREIYIFVYASVEIRPNR